VKKNDNRGLSLLELIVSVVILGILAAPLLHAFLTSANAARKTRIMDAATIAAANILETIKAERDLAGVEAAIAGIASPYTYGTRTYTVNDITFAPVTGSGVNDAAVVSYPENAISYGKETNPDFAAISYFVEASAAPVAAPAVLAGLSRVITFDVSESGANILLESAYSYAYGGETWSEAGYPMSFARDAAVYLFYYPLYGGAGDRIVINNNMGGADNVTFGGGGLSFYLVKQKPDAAMLALLGDEAALTALDAAYIAASSGRITLRQHYGTATEATVGSNIETGIVSLLTPSSPSKQYTNERHLRSGSVIPTAAALGLTVGNKTRADRLYNIAVTLTDNADAATVTLTGTKLIFPESGGE
jgi:prepilin-type N-terminal cleavage/methylation domain-containing protein